MNLKLPPEHSIKDYNFIFQCNSNANVFEANKHIFSYHIQRPNLDKQMYFALSKSFQTGSRNENMDDDVCDKER